VDGCRFYFADILLGRTMDENRKLVDLGQLAFEFVVPLP
jgi:hypothetical protein